MSDPAIAPTSVGAAAYEITASRGFIADLRLDVPISAPFPTLDLTYPTAAPGLQIMLVKGASELSLLPGPLNNDATFPKRLISTGSLEDGANTILTVEIKAAVMPAQGEQWRVQLRGEAAASYRLTQTENDPGFPTIALLMCDPVARFAIGGEATSVGGVATIKEKGVVVLEAGPALGPASLVRAFGAPAPLVHYRWTSAGPLAVTRLPACGDSPRAWFFAPHTASASEIHLSLDTWIEGGCPANVGWLSASTTAALRVEPLNAQFVVGPEIVVSSGDWYDNNPHYLLSEDNGIIAFWESAQRPNEPDNRIYSSRLDLGDIAAGFSPAQKVTTQYSGDPHAAPLPGGELLFTYRNHQLFNGEVCFKRAPLNGLSAAPERRITEAVSPSEEEPVVQVAGEIATFFFRNRQTETLEFRRFQLPGGTWIDTAPQLLFKKNGRLSSFSAARDRSGNVWAGLTTDLDNQWQGARLTPASGAKSFDIAETFPNLTSYWTTICFLCVSDDDIWVFRMTSDGIKCSRCVSGTWQAQFVPILPMSSPFFLHVVGDSAGGIWLFWSTYNNQIYTSSVTRRDPATGNWSNPQQLFDIGEIDAALITPDDTIWVFYTRQKPGPSFTNLFCRRIITAV